MTDKDFSDAVSNFKSMFSMSVEALLSACKMYVELLIASPAHKQRFQKECPEVADGLWDKLEAVGRGTMHVRVLLGCSEVYWYLEKVTYTKQEHAIKHGVEVLVANGDKLNVDVDNLTRSQMKQVFNGNKIRTIAGQRSYIEQLKAADRRKASMPEYILKKRRSDGEWVIIIPRRSSFTIDQMKCIVIEAEKTAK